MDTRLLLCQKERRSAIRLFFLTLVQSSLGCSSPEPLSLGFMESWVYSDSCVKVFQLDLCHFFRAQVLAHNTRIVVTNVLLCRAEDPQSHKLRQGAGICSGLGQLGALEP